MKMNDLFQSPKNEKYLVMKENDSEVVLASAEKLQALENGASKIGLGMQKEELTWRSIIIGTFIGCVLSAQNVYFGLRNGMSFGDGMVSAILGYGIIKILMKCMPFKNFNIHEHVILQTAAAANISIIFSGGFSQYILAMTPQVQEANQLGSPLDTWTPTYEYSVLWLAVAGYCGFFISQYYRKTLIVEQELPWPSPTATARVIEALHADPSVGAEFTRKIGISTLAAFTWQWFKWLFDASGHMSKWPIFGAAAASYTWYTDWSPAYIANGMLTTRSAVFSMVLGGIYGFGFIYPYVDSKKGLDGWYKADASGMQGAKAYWFLASLAMVVTDSVYQSLKLFVQSLKPLFAAHKNSPKKIEKEPPSRLIPEKFWIPAFAINVALISVLVPMLFPVKWYLIPPVCALAVLVGYSVNLGGALTGTFIVSAVAKLIILLFGSISGSVLGSLWLSGVGMITVGSSEQLLVDYQVGYITGTSPRSMFKAQLIAATVGFVVTPLNYQLFMRAFSITSDGTFTAPGGVALRSLAVLLVDGSSSLPGYAERFIIASVVIALVFSILKDVLPKKLAVFVPNTMAFAIGFYVNGSFPLNAFIGAVLREVWRYFSPKSETKFSSIIAGGMIAGEGIAAVSQAIFAILDVTPPAGMALQFNAYSQ